MTDRGKMAAMTGPSDESLLRDAGRGDGSAFEQIVERYADELFGFLRRRVGDAAAPDLLQDVFTRLYQAAPRYKPRAKARTYIYTVARNAACNHLRDRRESAPLSGQAADSRVSAEPAPDERLESAERAERIRRAVGTLSDPLREVVILRHYQKLRFREIAEVLQVPQGTAMRRMSDALDKLREQLGGLGTGG